MLTDEIECLLREKVQCLFKRLYRKDRVNTFHCMRNIEAEGDILTQNIFCFVSVYKARILRCKHLI